MTDNIDERIVDAARQYRHAAQVPRDMIWDRMEDARVTERRFAEGTATPARYRKWTRLAAAVCLATAGAAAAIAAEHMLRHRDVNAGLSTQPSAMSGLASYLASSDSLLTMFQASASGGRIRNDLEPWARELVSRTRSLEDSIVTTDSALRRLLADLDLVLVQIAQYASQPLRSEMEIYLINNAIETRGVATKLHAAQRHVAPSGL